MTSIANLQSVIVSSGVFVRSIVLIFITLICSSSFSFTAAQQNNHGVTIEGVVLDSAGAPIVEAQVQIANSGGLVAATTTRGDGSFRILTDNHQPLTLIVKAAGFATHEQQLSFTSQAALQIVLMPAGVSAKVTIAAARVEGRADETAATVVLLGILVFLQQHVWTWMIPPH